MIVVKLTDAIPPRDAVLVLAEEHRPFVLESAAPPGRYSFAGADPFLTLSLKGECIEELRCLLEVWDVPTEGLATPFPAGAVGWFSLVSGKPVASLAFYDAVATWDHHTGETTVVSTGLPAEGEAVEARASERSAWLCGLLGGRRPGRGSFPKLLSPLRSDSTRDEFLDAAEQARTGVAAGEQGEAQVWQRFSVESREPAHVIYGRLVRARPAPFAAWIRGGEEGDWVAASRERHFAADGPFPEILASIRKALDSKGEAIGYFSLTGRADFCTTDGALHVAEGRVTFRAGARIKADTDPGGAYEESMREARVLAAALGFKM